MENLQSNCETSVQLMSNSTSTGLILLGILCYMLSSTLATLVNLKGRLAYAGVSCHDIYTPEY